MKFSLAVLLLSVAAHAQNKTERPPAQVPPAAGMVFTAEQIEGILKKGYPGQDLSHYGSNQQFRRCANVRGEPDKLQDCLGLVVARRLSELLGPLSDSHFGPLQAPIRDVDAEGKRLPLNLSYVFPSREKNGMEPRLKDLKTDYEFVKKEADAQKAIFERLAEMHRCRGGAAEVTSSDYRMVIENGEFDFHSNPKYAAPSEAFEAKMAEWEKIHGECVRGGDGSAQGRTATQEEREEHGASLNRGSQRVGQTDIKGAFGGEGAAAGGTGAKAEPAARPDDAGSAPKPTPPPADGVKPAPIPAPSTLTSADFKPPIPARLAKKIVVPGPSASRCPTQEEKMNSIRKCHAAAESAGRATKAVDADLDECLKQVSSWWAREQAAASCKR